MRKKEKTPDPVPLRRSSADGLYLILDDNLWQPEGMAQSIVGIKVDGALTVIENGTLDVSINKALCISHDGALEILVCHSDLGMPSMECNSKRLYSLPEAFKGDFEQCVAVGVGLAHAVYAGNSGFTDSGPSIKSSCFHIEMSLTKTMTSTGR